jgi:hypothetical protein
MKSGRAASIAVFLTCANPITLGHAGLATTDISVTAALLFSCYAYHRWVLDPSRRASLLLMVALVMGLCSKFTYLIFFPICAFVISLSLRKSFSKAHASKAIVIAVFVFIGVETMYLFDGATPLSGFYEGLLEAKRHNAEGHPSYFLGERRRFGWWYFFPVVFAVKTPIPLLVLILLTLYHTVRHRSNIYSAPLLAAVLVMIAVLPSSINIGVRHILPIYPLLACSCAMVMDELIRAEKRVYKFLFTALVCLCVWEVIEVKRSWPDFIGYFNPLAGPAPEAVRVDSDLDWGQGVVELVHWTNKVQLTEPIGFYFFATSDPSQHGLRWRIISPWHPSAGWVAVSATELMMCRAARPAGEERPAWWWLSRERPLYRVGGNIIFHIEPGR